MKLERTTQGADIVCPFCGEFLCVDFCDEFDRPVSGVELASCPKCQNTLSVSAYMQYHVNTVNNET